ncbi:MAG: sensor histidine kinase [Candidatus Binatia bacterium]
MNNFVDDPREFAILCDSEGNLLQIVHDGLGIGEHLRPGNSWTVLLDDGSVRKARAFLATIDLRGRADGWEFNVERPKGFELLRFAGASTQDGVLIVGAAHPDVSLSRYQGWNETDETTSAGQSVLLFDEISRINNELINVKRELDKKNRQLTQLAAELETRVRERTAELETTNRRLQESMLERARAEEKAFHSERLAAVGATVAEIAHELANPLNAIYAAIQLGQLLLEEPELRRSDLTSLIADIQSEFDRLRSLLEALRSSTAKRKLQFKPTDLRALTEKFFSLQALEYEHGDIQVIQEFASDLPCIMADGDALTQVLHNLCKNSVEAMPDGGALTLRAFESAGHVVLEVIDSGSGVSEEIDAFKPFETTKPQGTGIGLAIVREIVSLHGGSIAYTTEQGRGTTFRVKLPVAAV